MSIHFQPPYPGALQNLSFGSTMQIWRKAMTALPTTCTWHAQDLRFQTLPPPKKKTTIYLDKTTNENVKDWKTSSSSDAWSFCQLCLEFLRWGPKNCKDSAVELIDDHWWYDLGPNLHVVHQLQKKFPGEQAVRMRRKLHQWDGLMSWKWSLWSRSGLSMFLYFPIWHSTDVKTVSSLGMTTKERHISYHNIVSYCRYHIILYIRHVLSCQIFWPPNTGTWGSEPSDIGSNPHIWIHWETITPSKHMGGS